MTCYEGNNASDAEIFLNFESGELKMDYHNNKWGSSLNSQFCIKDQTLTKETPLTRMRHDTFASLVDVTYFIPISIFISVLNSLGIIKTPKIPLAYQKFQKWRQIKCYGIYTQRKEGELNNNMLTIMLPSNLWFEYHLDGDYKKYVKNLSFTRKFVERKRYGLYPEKVQQGWELTFEFTQIPKTGSCSVDY